MLSGGKRLEQKSKMEVGGDDAACDNYAVSNFLILEYQKGNFLGEMHVRTQGGRKICIGTEKKRFPGPYAERSLVACI